MSMLEKFYLKLASQKVSVNKLKTDCWRTVGFFTQTMTTKPGLHVASVIAYKGLNVALLVQYCSTALCLCTKHIPYMCVGCRLHFHNR